MATAPSSGPSSLISSQPTSRRSRAASQSRSCSVNQRCRYSGPGSPRFSARARAAGLAIHSSRGHSSPPTCTYGLSKTSSSSVVQVEDDRHGFVGEVEHLGEDAEGGGRLVAGLGVVAQLGVGGQQGQDVAGELELGHHRDAAIRRVAHQRPQLVVGVETAVRGAVGEVLQVPLGLRPPAGPLLQLRIAVVRRTASPGPRSGAGGTRCTCAARARSTNRNRSASGMKCRPTSRCTPRQPNRGSSMIRTPSTLSGSPVGAGRRADGGSSWRRVWVAQLRPRAVAAVSSMPAAVTSTTYASSARLASLTRRRAPSAAAGSSRPVPGESSRRTTAAQPGWSVADRQILGQREAAGPGLGADGLWG